MAAPIGDTRSQPAVMPTRPASTPLSVSERDGFLYLNQATSNENIPPAQAARLVVRKTWEIAVRLPSPDAANCEPGLKPNQPNQRMKTPRLASARLCPGMARDFLSLSYFPIRGPRMAAPTRAIQPPTECTTVDPAKSWNVVPNVFIINEPSSPFINQPPPQVQCPLTG